MTDELLSIEEIIVSAAKLWSETNAFFKANPAFDASRWADEVKTPDYLAIARDLNNT